MANAQDSAALHKDLWYNEVNIDEVRALIKSAVENIKTECDTIVEVTDQWHDFPANTVHAQKVAIDLNKIIQDLQKIQDEMI